MYIIIICSFKRFCCKVLLPQIPIDITNEYFYRKNLISKTSVHINKKIIDCIKSMKVKWCWQYVL